MNVSVYDYEYVKFRNDVGAKWIPKQKNPLSFGFLQVRFIMLLRNKER